MLPGRPPPSLLPGAARRVGDPTAPALSPSVYRVRSGVPVAGGSPA